MAKYLLGIVLIVGIAGGLMLMQKKSPSPASVSPAPAPATAKTTVVAEGLEIPWDIAFLPTGDLLVSERPGRVVRIAKEGTKTPVSYDSDVKHRGEGGLLGLVLHPDFSRNSYVYLYVSTPAGAETKNRIERYKLVGNALTERSVILDDIPGATYHDGGRMEFGPDGYLYVTTGDATRPGLAQDPRSLGGKILRLKDDGTAAPGNPFGDRIYSLGHRNPQGLAWDEGGHLWESEHGPTGEQSLCCRDEINHIEAGWNYGWPAITADQTKEGMVAPTLHSKTDTWAPASLAYLDGSLYFGGLRGEALYEAILENGKIAELKTHFKGEFGRIRTVRVGPDGMLYITTSNRDGRGNVKAGDDKIIRIDPEQL